METRRGRRSSRSKESFDQKNVQEQMLKNNILGILFLILMIIMGLNLGGFTDKLSHFLFP